MAKGLKRSNRELKKPKADKKKVAPAALPFSSTQAVRKSDQGGAGKKAL